MTTISFMLLTIDDEYSQGQSQDANGYRGQPCGYSLGLLASCFGTYLVSLFPIEYIYGVDICKMSFDIVVNRFISLHAIA